MLYLTTGPCNLSLSGSSQVSSNAVGDTAVSLTLFGGPSGFSPLVTNCSTLPSLDLPSLFSANTLSWYTVHGRSPDTAADLAAPGNSDCLDSGCQFSLCSFHCTTIRSTLGTAPLLSAHPTLADLDPTSNTDKLAGVAGGSHIVTSMEKCEEPNAFVARQEYLDSITYYNMYPWLNKLITRSIPYLPASACSECVIFSFDVTLSNSLISVVEDFPGSVKYSLPSLRHLMLKYTVLCKCLERTSVNNTFFIRIPSREAES